VADVMLIPFNTFTVHSLISFMVTASLAVMFYIVYLKAGRRKLDLLSANFIACISATCLYYFLIDNLVPAGESAMGWPGGPTAEALRLTTFELYRWGWTCGIFLLPLQLHFVLYYCQSRNFLRRHIWIAYCLAALSVTTVWTTSLWSTACESPLAETSSWEVTIPWLPEAGPAAYVLLICTLSMEVYGLVLLWKTRRVSVTEFSESLGGRLIVFAAFVVQIAVSSVDVVNGALMLPVPAATPIGSGIMGVLLATALIRSRVESDRRKLQLEREKAGLLECVPQPLLYLGNDLEIQWTNDDAAEFTGRDLEDLVGTRADEIWPADGEELQPARQALATAVPATHEISRDDGSTWVVHASPVVDPKGESLGVILLAMDITDIRRAQEALRQANVKILTAREEERRRVAQDLHDSIAQGLTALQMTLHTQAEDVGADTPAGQKFDQASRKAGQLGTEVRQISHQLYPPALDLLGLASALEEIFDPYVATGIDCTLDCPDDVLTARFTQEVEVALYRTVQEAISNAVRHGQAQSVTVRLEQTSDYIQVTVIDDGCGFDVKANSKGLGMTSMTSRIDGVGGKLEITSKPGHTSVKASVPLERARRAELEAVAGS